MFDFTTPAVLKKSAQLFGSMTGRYLDQAIQNEVANKQEHVQSVEQHSRKVTMRVATRARKFDQDLLTELRALPSALTKAEQAELDTFFDSVKPKASEE